MSANQCRVLARPRPSHGRVGREPSTNARSKLRERLLRRNLVVLPQGRRNKMRHGKWSCQCECATGASRLVRSDPVSTSSIADGDVAGYAWKVAGEDPDPFCVRPRRVLLVDDSRARLGLETLLNMLGHHTVGVARGATAVELFRSFDPDAVVIDLGLPDMDGCDVARRMKFEARRRLPLMIAFTGWNRPEDFARTSSAGFDHHLVKPCSVNKLETLISTRPIGRACRRRTDPQSTTS